MKGMGFKNQKMRLLSILLAGILLFENSMFSYAQEPPVQTEVTRQEEGQEVEPVMGDTGEAEQSTEPAENSDGVGEASLTGEDSDDARDPGTSDTQDTALPSEDTTEDQQENTNPTDTEPSDTAEAPNEEEIAAAAEEREMSVEELGYVPGEILIAYKGDVSEAEISQMAEKKDGEFGETIAEVGDESIAVVSISDDTTVETAVEEYMQDPNVEYAEPNYIMELYDDEVGAAAESTANQWYLNYVKAPAAWNELANYNGSTVRVGVIDTGARVNHEDLTRVINKEKSIELIYTESGNSYQYYQRRLQGDGYLNGSSYQNSRTTHGTHVSGIIAAESCNNVGIQGTASGGMTGIRNSMVELVVIDAFTRMDSRGEDTATVLDVIHALLYAEDVGCRVVNLSLGTLQRSDSLESVCQAVKDAGITIVCAAGNESTTAPSYPSDYASTISVININENGTKSSTSNYGNAKDISAPGVNIYSTMSAGINSYGMLSGTSMAAPIVTAAAAMILYKNPGLSPDQVKSILCSTAKDLGTPGKDIYTGYGALDIAAAVNKAGGMSPPVANDKTGVTYRVHAQTYGWREWTSNGKTSGTVGEAKRLEAIEIRLTDQAYPGDIEYTTHVQTKGWATPSKNGMWNGTVGEAKRLEAIQIRLTGEMAQHYDVYYRVHAQTFGWMGWAKNGASAGTAGYAKRLEAIEIQLVKKGGKAPGDMSGSFRHPLVRYRTHVQTYGWQGARQDGEMSGTTGEAKRLEGICIELPSQDYAGSVQYRTHVQTYDWQPFVENNEMSGTSGQAKRLEAIEIKLTGDMAVHYDIYYRVHAQTFGWLDWAKNGQPAGTAGLAKRLEGIEIRLVPKNGAAPGPTSIPFIEKASLVSGMKISNHTNQILLVNANRGSSAQVELWSKTNGTWAVTKSMNGYVGSLGVGAPREYVPRTPQGPYTLGFAFGMGPNPGTKLNYRQITPYSYWIGDKTDRIT